MIIKILRVYGEIYGTRKRERPRWRSIQNAKEDLRKMVIIKWWEVMDTDELGELRGRLKPTPGLISVLPIVQFDVATISQQFNIFCFGE